MSEHQLPGGHNYEQTGDGRWFVQERLGRDVVEINTDDAILVSEHGMSIPTLRAPYVVGNIYDALYLSANAGMEIVTFVGRTSYVVGVKETIFPESAEIA